MKTQILYKMSPGMVLDFVTNEYIKLTGLCSYTSIPIGWLRFLNPGVRGFDLMPSYYIISHEFRFGPFRCFEEAEAELVYLSDPLSLNYIPGQEYKIVRL
jgi:hypothetical protein